MDKKIIPNYISNKKLTPFCLGVIQNFPFIEQDFDAITDYQLLCKVVEYINKINSNVNTIDENTKKLYDSYVELYNYVNNYFSSLEIQDEINNKLDEMYESGLFDAILTDYSKLIKIYNTTEAMLTDAENLIAGQKIKTLGFSTINDAGASDFIIRDSENINVFQFNLGNGLYAELIKNGPVNARQLGCKESINNSEILNNYLDKYNDTGLIFTKGNYPIESEIATKGSVLMDSESYLIATAQMDSMVHVNKNLTNVTSFTSDFPRNTKLNLNLNCNKLAITGVRTDRLHWAKCEFTIINPVTYGAYINYIGTPHAENTFDIQCSCDSEYSNANVTGAYIRGSDDIFNNITTINCKTGVELVGGDNTIRTIHSWLSSAVFWSGSVTLKIHLRKNHIGELISDTMEKGIMLISSSNYPFALYIDFMFAMVHTGIISNELAENFEICDFTNMSESTEKNSTFYINNYVGSDDYTAKLKFGANGKCPINSTLIYNTDYQIPEWIYSLDYAPQGNYFISGSKNLKGKPSSISSGQYNLQTINTGYGKIQRLTRTSYDVSGETVFENGKPISNFRRSYERTFEKYGNGNNVWGVYASFTNVLPSE